MSHSTRSRRWLLRTTGTAVAAAVGTGAASSTAGAADAQENPSVSLSNDVYDVDLGVFQTTGGWVYNDVGTLYGETFNLEIDGAFIQVTESEVTDPFPGQGEAGQRYDATAELPVDAPLTFQRGVTLSASDPRFDVYYEIQNAGEQAIDSLSLYQYVDYDIAGASGDTGGFDEDLGEVWQRSSVGGETVFTGYRGSRAPASWSVADVNTAGTEYTAGNLSGSDSYEGDVGTAVEWDLGPIGSGETASLAIGFAAADSRENLDGNLSSVNDPAVQTAQAGGGDDLLPGFGIGAAAAGLAGSAYALSRRGDEGDDAE